MPTKKRPKSNRQIDEVGRVVRERLEEVRKENKMTVAEFTAAIRGKEREPGGHSQMVAWRSGRTVPGGRNLRRIAERFDVSVDWLVGVPGATKRLSQNRSDDGIAADLAAYVSRGVAAVIARQRRWVSPAMIEVDGEMLLASTVEHLAARFETDLERYVREMEPETSAAQAARALGLNLGKLTARMTKADRGELHRAMMEASLRLLAERRRSFFADSPVRPNPEREADLVGEAAARRRGKWLLNIAKDAGLEPDANRVLMSLLGADYQ